MKRGFFQKHKLEELSLEKDGFVYAVEFGMYDDEGISCDGYMEMRWVSPMRAGCKMSQGAHYVPELVCGPFGWWLLKEFGALFEEMAKIEQERKQREPDLVGNVIKGKPIPRPTEFANMTPFEFVKLLKKHGFVNLTKETASWGI